MLIYQGQIQPLKYKRENRLEIFNEWIVTCCYLYSVVFTQFAENSVQYYTGWVVVLLVAALITVNMTLVLQQTGRKFYLIGLKYYRRIDARFNKK